MSKRNLAIIALGSNMGDRLNNLKTGLTEMKNFGISILRHSCLYETAPAYVTEQPKFVNGAVLVNTNLQPINLLHALKQIEQKIGRNLNSDQQIRFGPRPLDLDIICYNDEKIELNYENSYQKQEQIQLFGQNQQILQIPHPRWMERDFVQAPIFDLIDANEINKFSEIQTFYENLIAIYTERKVRERLGSTEISRIIPINNEKMINYEKKTSVMGILNVTPDSFSDGGEFSEIQTAIQHANQMISDGANFIDIGGQSTRPGALTIPPEQELSRIIPIIQQFKQQLNNNDVIISVDTFYSEVAKKVLEAGADVINDISGGKFDKNMFEFIGQQNCAYVLMHMRGTPQTMQNKINTQYDDLIKQVSDELQQQIDEAVLQGIEPWRIIIDPGIGFAKTFEGNCRLLQNLNRIREGLNGCGRFLPMLIGPSRKGFLGKITGRELGCDRDPGSWAACVGGVLKGANIVRVHAVKGAVDSVKVADAMKLQT